MPATATAVAAATPAAMTTTTANIKNVKPAFWYFIVFEKRRMGDTEEGVGWWVCGKVFTFFLISKGYTCHTMEHINLHMYACMHTDTHTLVCVRVCAVACLFCCSQKLSQPSFAFYFKNIRSVTTTKTKMVVNITNERFV